MKYIHSFKGKDTGAEKIVWVKSRGRSSAETVILLYPTPFKRPQGFHRKVEHKKLAAYSHTI